MKVFSKEKFIEVEGRKCYEEAKRIMGESWIDKCDGKEVFNFKDVGFGIKVGECKGDIINYRIEEKWCVEKDNLKDEKKEEKSMEKRVEIEMSSIEDKVKGANAVICCSDKGTYLNGAGMDLLMVFSSIVSDLKKNGVPEMFLQTAFEIGLDGMDEIDDKAKKLADVTSQEEIKKELDNVIGKIADLFKERK